MLFLLSIHRVCLFLKFVSKELKEGGGCKRAVGEWVLTIGRKSRRERTCICV